MGSTDRLFAAIDPTRTSSTRCWRRPDPSATNDGGGSAISLAEAAGHPWTVALVRSALGV